MSCSTNFSFCSDSAFGNQGISDAIERVRDLATQRRLFTTWVTPKVRRVAVKINVISSARIGKEEEKNGLFDSSDQTSSSTESRSDIGVRKTPLFARQVFEH